MNPEILVQLFQTAITAIVSGGAVYVGIRKDIQNLHARLEYVESVTWKKDVEKARGK